METDEDRNLNWRPNLDKKPVPCVQWTGENKEEIIEFFHSFGEKTPIFENQTFIFFPDAGGIRVLPQDWIYKSEIYGFGVSRLEPHLANAIRVVDNSIDEMQKTLDRIMDTYWPGVDDLLKNRSSRAILETKVYLSEALNSLRKAKKRLEDSHEE